MGRPRCDPIDVAATLARLNAGAPRPAVYRAYAEIAARPYSRASWEALLRLGQASLARSPSKDGRLSTPYASEGRHGATVAIGGPISDAGADPRSEARADAESDAFWEARLAIKPRVITTEADNANLYVRGGSLFVGDGARRLRFDPGSRMPSAIVMAGWGGVVSIEAMRFCASHGVAIIVLDWMRELMSVMPARASESAAMLRAQASADPLPIAIRIVQAKIACGAQAGALSSSVAARFINMATHAQRARDDDCRSASRSRSVAKHPEPSLAGWVATHSAAMETAAANSIAHDRRGPVEASRHTSPERPFVRLL